LFSTSCGSGAPRDWWAAPLDFCAVRTLEMLAARVGLAAKLCLSAITRDQILANALPQAVQHHRRRLELGARRRRDQLLQHGALRGLRFDEVDPFGGDLVFAVKVEL